MRENLRTIEQSVYRIDRIVLDLMDTVSIEQGRLPFSCTIASWEHFYILWRKISAVIKSGEPSGPPNITRTPGNLSRPGTADQVIANLISMQSVTPETEPSLFLLQANRGLADHLRLRHWNRHVRRNAKKHTQRVMFPLIKITGGTA